MKQRSFAPLMLMLALLGWCGGPSLAIAQDVPNPEAPIDPPNLGQEGFAPSTAPNPLTPDDYRRIVGTVEADAGDELTIAEFEGARGTKIKLWGIDAPDPGQICRTRRGAEYPCGDFARNVLAGFTKNQQVMCSLEFTRVTRDNVARCQIANVDLAAAMISAGWAFAQPKVTSNYARIQSAAQARKRGMWAGRVEPPWNFRSRLNADPAADPGPPMITYDYGR